MRRSMRTKALLFQILYLEWLWTHLFHMLKRQLLPSRTSQDWMPGFLDLSFYFLYVRRARTLVLRGSCSSITYISYWHVPSSRKKSNARNAGIKEARKSHHQQKQDWESKKRKSLLQERKKGLANTKRLTTGTRNGHITLLTRFWHDGLASVVLS